MFKKRILLFVLALAGAVAALQLTRGTANETPIKPPPYEPATRDKDGLIAAAGLIEAAAENTLLFAFICNNFLINLKVFAEII